VKTPRTWCTRARLSWFTMRERLTLTMSPVLASLVRHGAAPSILQRALQGRSKAAKYNFPHTQPQMRLNATLGRTARQHCLLPVHARKNLRSRTLQSAHNRPNGTPMSDDVPCTLHANKIASWNTTSLPSSSRLRLTALPGLLRVASSWSRNLSCPPDTPRCSILHALRWRRARPHA
jgi:hypothetical protein